MAPIVEQPTGLTLIIYETLLDLTAELPNRGATWDEETLSQVKQDVKDHFRAYYRNRPSFVFEAVFDRAYEEAAGMVKELMENGWLETLASFEPRYAAMA